MAQSKKEEKINIKKLYGFECISSKEDFLKKYKIDLEKGLSNEQVENRLSTYGKNEMKQKKQKKWYNYLWDSLLSPFNIILMGITIILIYTDIILTSPPSYANIIVILVLVLASTLLEFFEVYNSNKAAEKLKDLVATTCTVIRNETKIKIPLNEITIGDVILLSAGDIIPADVRVLEAKDLYITQSSLTGESDSVKKSSSTELPSIDEIESITDLDTICFMGTNVTSGSGKAIVIKTGDSTYFGKVANTITSGKPITSFQKGINNLSKLLIRFMLILIPITFLLNNAKHGSLTAFTFSVAIAIGITPLLLPVILSSSLSKGAVKMSKKKTIVKRLDSIQSFGSMNILCTDKTGTLTEDNIVLEKYLDIKGNEDKKILEYVFLNSYFQTGLKGNIDEAVIKRAEKEEINVIASKYKKIDEIPFDFSRRRLSVIVSDGTSKKLITKGAIEEILSVCTTVNYKDTINPITSDIKNNILSISKNLNIQGMRVIGVCQKTDIENISEFSVKDESKMTFLGFIGFLDPPKESAKSAIERLNSYGVRVMVLTGDNEYVTRAICEKVNISTKRILTGNKVDKLSDMALLRLLRSTNVLAKLSPIQKARIVRLLRESGNIVGYMGDGINDAPSLTNAEVGISVDTAVDIAKETADIILLEKDLHVLVDGVVEGRKTFGNLLKYIKMAVSFNFGEVLSVLIASILLPFMPITPIQLLVQSLLYDFGQLSLPLDHVDKEYLEKPRRWNLTSIKNFMLFMGPTSSIFDLLVFSILWYGFKLRAPDVALFQTIWFSYGVVSNLVGLHVIRTSKIPFFQSHASKGVYLSSITLSIVALIIPFTFIGNFIGLVALPLKYIALIITIPILYCFLALFVKKLYIKKYGEWI
ncbi:magnesium-translocating P-type ATPase [Clostridium sp. CAG:571]|jgi:Mg2+-importing ATPase|nr:magnesium-translocating P-type ATPase [Clostridium sp. CAG:571]HJJ06995.1 magnesium-translocating P-type ATPase [Clostridiaceae bacterium]